MKKQDIQRIAEEAGLALTTTAQELIFEVAYKLGAESEREACAQVADYWRENDDWPCGDGIGKAIRARGTR